jgi:hypothetical protein
MLRDALRSELRVWRDPEKAFELSLYRYDGKRCVARQIQALVYGPRRFALLA